jgi:rubrerythrin
MGKGTSKNKPERASGAGEGEEELTTEKRSAAPAEAMETSGRAEEGEENPEETEEEEEEEEAEEAEEEEEDEEVEVGARDRSDADVLIALGELDAEAAQAYRIAATAIEDPAIRSKLEEFADDHLRHVQTINRILSAGEVPEISVELDEGSSAMTMLAAAVAGMGDRAALLTLIGNEQLTNSAYPMAMELPFEEEVARVLERHAADEQRHLQWLVQQEARVRESGAEVGVDV